MREIKFEFIYYNGLVNKYAKIVHTVDEILENGITHETLSEYINENYLCTSDTDWEYELLAKRLCIGLEDKNKKDIYNGDIVSIELETNNFVIAYIFFNVQRGKYIVHYINDDLDEDFDDWNNISHFEVIGNIYQNKELLGDN